MFVARCLLIVVRCVWSVACCSLIIADRCCSLVVSSCLLLFVYWLSLAVCSWLVAACGLLIVVWLLVGCCWLFVARCRLLVAR